VTFPCCWWGWIQVLPAAEEQAGHASSKKSLTATERIAELEQQIKAITADIARATADRLAIDDKLEQLRRNHIADAILQEWLDMEIDLQDIPNPKAARRDLIARLANEKETLSKKENLLREEKNLLLGKSPGGGLTAAAAAAGMEWFPRLPIPATPHGFLPV
jgi:hypothetical protein